MTAHVKTLTESIIPTDSLRKIRPGVLLADSARVSVSSLLRFFRRPIKYVSVELPLEYSNLEPGDTIWADHDLIPEMTASTSAVEAWRLVPLYVASVADSIQPPKITLKCIDLRDIYCTWWSPLLTNVGMTDDLQGIAIFDQSGGWETSRAQVAFGERPGGDQTFQPVAEDTPVIDAYGLLLQGGGDTNLLLNSSFSEGAGDVFTSWTSNTSGAGIAASWALYTLIDGDGYRRSCQVATYAAGEAANLSQTVSTVDDKLLYVRFWYRNGGTYDPTVIRIQRSDSNEYWRDSDGTWQAGAIDNEVTDSGAWFIGLWRSKLLDMTGISCDLTISVGYFSAVHVGGQISSLEGVELQEISGAGRYFESMRGPLPTKAAAVTRVANLTWINNDSATRVLEGTRGFVKVDVTPLWSHDQLTDGDFKYVWCAELNALYNFRCYYERVDADTGRWRFDKYWNYTLSSAYYTVTSGDGTLAAAGTSYSVGCRWNSVVYDEFGLAGQAIQLWLGGVKGEVEYTDTSDPTVDPVCQVYLGSLPIGAGMAADDSVYGDCHLTNLVIGKHCPTDAEMARF